MGDESLHTQIISYSLLHLLFSFIHFAGETMRIASSEFADDPCSSVKRGTMVRAARALLSAVTRLLILADMADVMRLLAHLKIVSAVNTQPSILLGYVVMELYLELQHFKYIYMCVKNTHSPNLYVVLSLLKEGQ